MFRSHKDIFRVPNGTKPVKTTEDSAESEDDQFECDMCDLSWFTELDLEIHRRKQHIDDMVRLVNNDKRHVCKICVRAHKDAESLLSHVKSEHLLSSPTAERIEREIFICDKCEHIFFNKSLLTLHIQYVHCNIKYRDGNTEKLMCGICNKNVRFKYMWGHLRPHHLNMPATCQICFSQLKNKMKLHIHLKSHPYHLFCEVCGYSMNNTQLFSEHAKKHKSRKIDNTYGKSVMTYFIPSRTHKLWKYKYETGVKGLKLYHVYICIICRQICRSLDDMWIHVSVEHMPLRQEKRRYICACGEEFFNAVLLKHHVFKMKGIHRMLVEDETVALSYEEESDECKGPPVKRELYEMTLNSSELVDVYAVQEEIINEDPEDPLQDSVSNL